MVITAAMAHGLPAITTTYSAGRDLIVNRADGLLVPVCDPDALASEMQWCIDNPLELAALGQRVRETAGHWQWQDFRAGSGRVVTEILGQGNGDS